MLSITSLHGSGVIQFISSMLCHFRSFTVLDSSLYTLSSKYPHRKSSIHFSVSDFFLNIEVYISLWINLSELFSLSSWEEHIACSNSLVKEEFWSQLYHENWVSLWCMIEDRLGTCLSKRQGNSGDAALFVLFSVVSLKMDVITRACVSKPRAYTHQL